MIPYMIRATLNKQKRFLVLFYPGLHRLFAESRFAKTLLCGAFGVLCDFAGYSLSFTTSAWFHFFIVRMAAR